MKAADLRKSILQAAVQGKLVPQDKNDEPASELLKRIQAEKAALIKEGKLKKGKPLSLITEDGIPYDLPEGWVWCRLGELSYMIHYGYTASASQNGNVHLLRITDIQNDSVDWENVPYCTVPDKQLPAYELKDRDILIARTGGTVGKTYIINGLKCKSVFASYLIRVILSIKLNEQYLRRYLQSPFYWEQIGIKSTGTGQPNVNGIALSNLLVALPPFAEQQRIVAKVDELMALCDDLEAAEKEQEALEKHLSEDLPKAILQSAVQGKLVPQDKSDEPASELLKRIQTEKTALIKSGKLKKEKPLPPITEDEIPYDLPEGWVWCRLGEISNLIMGQSPNGVSVSTNENGIEFHQGKSFFGEKYLQKSNQTTTSPSKIVPPNCILLAVRAPVGDVNIVDREICIGRGLCAVTLFCSMDINFMYYWLQAQKQSFIQKATGTTFIAITGNIVKNQLIPLPPFSEQQRIVAKVDELMELCEELKKVDARPIACSNVMPFPTTAEANSESVAMAARGDANNLSAQAKQAIEDLFAEDE